MILFDYCGTILYFSVEERDQCVTKRDNLEQKLKSGERSMGKLHVNLTEAKESVAFCKTELDSLKKVDVTKTASLDALRLEKEELNAQLERAKDKEQKLEEQVHSVNLYLSIFSDIAVVYISLPFIMF